MKSLFLDLSDRTRLDREWRQIFQIGFYAFLLILAKFLFDAVYGGLINPPTPDPNTTLGWFELFKRDPLYGLFCFNLFDAFWMIGLVPFYIALFFSLKDVNRSVSLVALAIGIIGIVCYLSANNALAFLQLSGQYWAEKDQSIREQFLVAGTGVIASGFGTGVVIGALFIVLSGLAFSIVMFWSSLYRRFIPILSIVAHGVGIFAILLHTQRSFIPLAGTIALGIAVLCYMLWYIPLGISFFFLGRGADTSRYFPALGRE